MKIRSGVGGTEPIAMFSQRHRGRYGNRRVEFSNLGGERRSATAVG